MVIHLLAFPASGRPGGALAGMWRYTVKFDIALALQLRSQNVLLIAEALSDIEDVTWKVIKVWLGLLSVHESAHIYQLCLCINNITFLG